MKAFTKTFLKTFTILLALVIVVGVVASFRPPSPEQIAYFKSERNNRVYAYVATDGMTDEEAMTFLAGQMQTKGQSTHAVMYRPGVPNAAAALNRATNLEEAYAAILDDGNMSWTWGVFQFPTGLKQFWVDGDIRHEWKDED